jgi:hypothetical protein
MMLAQPIPKNLREIMVNRLSAMDDEALVRLHDLDLLAEKIRLRDLMSEQAETEQAAGNWADLSEVVRAYRDRNKGS